MNTKDKTALVFEVKRSTQKLPSQKKHLINQELRDDFERVTGSTIIGQAMLYSGQSSHDDDNFLYINSSEWLKDLSSSMAKYFPEFNGENSGPESPKRNLITRNKNASKNIPSEFTDIADKSSHQAVKDEDGLGK